MTPARPHRTLASRLGIVVAAVAGFAVGAAGFAAAQQGDPLPVASPSEAPSPSADPQVVTTVDDGPATSVDDGPVTSVDDGPATSVDDGPVTTVDEEPTTTVSRGLPAPFSETYSSVGGSIAVAWSGTTFSLDAVSPAPGFRAEIEQQSWDRVRVDFDGEERDARIEVRINDGQLRVRVD